MKTLTITPIKATRNGRFMHSVQGSPELLAEYRNLVLSKTFISGGLTADGTGLLFFSNVAHLPGTALTKGNNCWFVDTMSADIVLNKLNSNPALIALLDETDKAALKRALGLDLLTKPKALSQDQPAPQDPEPTPQADDDEEL